MGGRKERLFIIQFKHYIPSKKKPPLSGGFEIRYSISLFETTPGTPGMGFGAGVLPVKLHFFDYVIINNTVQLSWRVTQDSENDLYIVQRKTGSNWEDLQTFTAAGLPGWDVSYSFVDPSPLPENQYRLKLIGRNNDLTFSKVIYVKLNQKLLMVSASPNPSKNSTIINWHKPITATISVYNFAGALVMEENISQKTETVMNTGLLNNGQYLIVLRSENSILGKLMITVGH